MTPAAMAVAAALLVTPTARAMQPGEPVLVSITSEQALTSVQVEAFDVHTPAFKPDAADPRHWEALIGIDLDAALGRHAVKVTATAAGGPLTSTIELDVKPKKFPTRRLSVDEAFVNPPASVQPRIAAEMKAQQAIWASPAKTRLWEGGFRRPVPQPANSAFGTRSVFNGQPRSAHSGADFLSPAGTPIQAPAAGRVVLARNLYYSGNSVIIDHGLGVFSFLAHMSKIDVAVGDEVASGDIVGLVGATGRVTGPHLHWTLRVAGARVDPLALLTILK